MMLKSLRNIWKVYFQTGNLNIKICGHPGMRLGWGDDLSKDELYWHSFDGVTLKSVMVFTGLGKRFCCGESIVGVLMMNLIVAQ